MQSITYNFGERFPYTRLCYLHDIPRVTKTKRRAVFICDCGNKIEADIGHVRSKKTTSCGCYQLERSKEVQTKHGQNTRAGRTPEYRTWVSMHERAGKKEGYEHVSVCARWSSFENFYADMGKRPKGHSIERKNNLGHYEPSNCIWADNITQASNRSDNIHVTINNETKTVSSWCREYGISRFTVSSRMRSGMSAEKAITTPLMRKKKQ